MARQNRAVFHSSKLEGAKELDQIMRDLPAKFRKRGVKSAFQEGGRLLLSEIRGNAPSNVFSDNEIHLVPAGSTRAYKSPNANDLYAIAVSQPKSRLAHIFEFGTGERVQKTTGRRTGRIRQEPFMRVSVLTKGDYVVKRIIDQLWVNMRFLLKELNAGNNPDLRKLKSGRR